MNTELTIKEIAAAQIDSVDTGTSLSSAPASAGFPAPGDDQVERSLDINDVVVKNPASTFFVKVEGDSMTGAGIFSGDILVIDRSKEIENSSIVVATINGEMLVKRIKMIHNASSLVLVSENETCEPVEVGENEDCMVWGVVTGSVRVF